MTDNEFLEQDRIQKIQQIVGKYGEDKFSLSFSGGRDSTILSAFLDIALPGNQIPRLYADTGIELNEVRAFVNHKAEADNRIFMIKPSVPIKQMLEQKGYPFKSKKHAYMCQLYRKFGGDIAEHDGLKNYLGVGEKHWSSSNSCPKRLKYQFTQEYLENGFPISDECCLQLKENPLKKWEKEHGIEIAITAILKEEGGRRQNAQCLVFRGNKPRTFQPFAPVTNDFLNYLVEKYGIELCKLYYPPYNFVRTGCKGCPFALELQEELDTLERFFPKERAQCEIIWKPVYDEYRRLGYRLRKDDGQINMFDNKKQGDLGA